MIRLKCISSGSSGNCYLLDSGGETLILECGVPYGVIARHLKYDFSRVVGCICSHPHGDHLNKDVASTFSKYDIPLYGNEAVVRACRNFQLVEHKRQFVVGRWTVMPLDVPHGDCHNCAFVIIGPDGDRVLFATDLEKFPYNVPNLNHILIEANYSEEILIRKVMENGDVRSKSSTHMEVNTTLETLRRLYSPALRTVMLLHISKNVGNKKEFRDIFLAELEEMESIARCWCANAGRSHSLSLYPWDFEFDDEEDEEITVTEK